MNTDLRIALRKLIKSPGFALTAVITLALGIGANAVVFSVLNALVLHPVKLPDAQSLYTVQRYDGPSQSYPDYIDLRDRNRSFQSLFLVQIVGAVGVSTGAGTPSTAWPYMASGNYFDALGIQPYLGRFFHPADEKGPDSAPYIVLSYAFWHSYFHADPGVLGRAVQINRRPLTVIGVAPPEFRGTELFFAPAMWIPMVQAPSIMGSHLLTSRGNHSPWVVGRLKPGVTVAQATADLDAIGAWLAKTYPETDDGIKFSLARPGLLGDFLGGPARAFMAGLMLLAALILLAACANLGSLFAARTADRARDMALRLALGSRRKLILRQLFTEALLVSLIGGAVGLAGSAVILRVLSAWQPLPDIPINVPVNPDIRTCLVALGLALVSGMLFGMVPVGHVLRADPWQVLRTGAFGSRIRRFSLRDILLVSQIAICAFLVTSSLVAVRGLDRSLHSNFGFKPQNAILAEMELQMAGYAGDNIPPVERRMLGVVKSIPGVTAAGYITGIPLSLSGGDSYVYSDTTTDFRPTTQIADAMDYNVSPGYFEAAGTHMLAGRDIRFEDDKQAPDIAVVNRRFAERVFGSVEKAIGGHFKYGKGMRIEVVGVVEDGKYRTLTEEQMPAMFFSFQQQNNSSTNLVVRTNRDTQDISRAIEQALHGIDSGLPVLIRPWEKEMDSALFAPRVASVALGVLGMLGAMLAVTGIFGMASYTVSKRLRELGIRVALGAGHREVLRASLGHAFRVLVIGSVAGLVLGLLGTRVLSSIVYQASPRDPVVLGGVILTMLLLGLLAALVPARRALAVDPMMLLREE